jgi:O-antigen/teichoic acid export membrane protein
MSLLQLLASVPPRRLFLIDAIGALISGSLLAFVLTSYEHLFGVSTDTLNVLAMIAFSFSVYSFSCFLINPKKWRLFMRLIASANLLYCCLTAIWVLGFHPEITLLGIAYFVGEIILVTGLALFEWKRTVSSEAEAEF